MDKRIKHMDHERDRLDRDQMYTQISTGKLSLAQAIKCMRQLSKLTQPEFAIHRGISLDTLRMLESGKGNPTVDTVNKVVSIFGLEIGLVRKQRK